MARGELRIGTSGWHYQHWRGPFYPAAMGPSRFLDWYAERLDTVEINGSFYRLPERETFEAWRDAVPPGFVFAVKASRYITHMKKLKDPQEPLRLLYERAEGLGDRLGPILFQLPPRWRLNLERLHEFLDALSTNHRHAFELRDPTWFDERVYADLRAHNAAFCIYEIAGRTSPRVVTSDLVYLRLHGPGEHAYTGRYGDAALRAWLDAFEGWRGEGRDVYCYFDNDQAGYAAENAVTMAAMAAS